jgi:hypothetical protein
VLKPAAENSDERNRSASLPLAGARKRMPASCSHSNMNTQSNWLDASASEKAV